MQDSHAAIVHQPQRDMEDIADDHDLQGHDPLQTRVQGGTVSDYPHPRMRNIKTGCMFLISFMFGVYVSLTGPTMRDLTDIYHCNYEELSQAVTMRGLGMFFGSMFAGYMVDRRRRWSDVTIGVLCVCMGVANAAIPYGSHLVVCGILFTVLGVAQGALNVMCCSLLMAIWGEKASPPTHLFQFGFAVGGTLGPPSTTPFLSPSPTNSSHNGSTLQDLQVLTDTFWGPGNATHIQVPYIAYGAFGVIVGVIFFVFSCMVYIYETDQILQKRSIKDLVSCGACAEGRSCFGFYMVFSLLFMYIGIVGINFTLQLYVAPIALESGMMSKALASICVTSYRASAALGRGLATLFSRYVPAQIMLFVEVTGTLLGAIVLVLFGLDSAATYWTLVCVLGVMAGPNYPTTMAWADRYIEVTGCVVTVIDFGVSGGTFLGGLLNGYLLQNHGPQYVLYTIVGGVCMMLCIIIPLQVIAHIQGDRHKRRQQQIEQGHPDESAPLIQ